MQYAIRKNQMVDKFHSRKKSFKHNSKYLVLMNRTNTIHIK